MMYKVAYATGSRAEYGIVKNYLKALSNIETIDLDILVTGSHLERKFGYTKEEIVKDGFKIKFEAPLSIETTDNSNIIHSMSIALDKFGKFFSKNKYDLLIILGDRYEMMAVSIAAAMNKQTILHLHGGEITLGNYDEFIRHSITKMSHYHFTSTPQYKQRVIQLGEHPKNVYYMGALGAFNALNNVDKNFTVPWSEPYFVILFHPETLTSVSTKSQITELIDALDYFKDKYHFVFIGSNADTHSNEIFNLVIKYAKKTNSTYITNLENYEFQNIINKAELFIGNSSSGIIEAPSLGTYSINIGDRQRGRIKSNSIIDSKCIKEDIINSIKIGLIKTKSDEKILNPYFKENTLNEYIKQTIEILKQHKNNIKNFYDL
ncbi:UDP-N-acetylglucosamine 2-epimerase [Facklamia sp. P12937]|uniref:UDP-N-acetylglucosamine 2-epimerase n=1 Tax=Facklamia sp. P12937 TaxID=3421949 RepID=UPI003D166599